jgi:LPXTG-motif cell wall-anchored protein
MREQFPPINTNLASVRVVGIPGLSLVVIVIAIAFEFPQSRWLFLSGLAGGALLGAALILVRRRRSFGPLPSLRRGGGAALHDRHRDL